MHTSGRLSPIRVVVVIADTADVVHQRQRLRREEGTRRHPADLAGAIDRLAVAVLVLLPARGGSRLAGDVLPVNLAVADHCIALARSNTAGPQLRGLVGKTRVR